MNNALKIWEQTLLGMTNILHLRVRILPDDSSENSTYYSCIEREERGMNTARFTGSSPTKARGVNRWLVIVHKWYNDYKQWDDLNVSAGRKFVISFFVA